MNVIQIKEYFINTFCCLLLSIFISKASECAVIWYMWNYHKLIAFNLECYIITFDISLYVPLRYYNMPFIKQKCCFCYLVKWMSYILRKDNNVWFWHATHEHLIQQFFWFLRPRNNCCRTVASFGTVSTSFWRKR